MNYSIKELRDLTGMTQREFALRYQIPVSTLRKWEQGDASPAKYFVSLLAGSIPGTSEHLLRLEGKDGKIFYYDPIRQMVYDEQGNGIAVEENLSEVKSANLAIYLEDLFESFYEIRNKFNRDCRLDRDDDIIWSR